MAAAFQLSAVMEGGSGKCSALCNSRVYPDKTPQMLFTYFYTRIAARSLEVVGILKDTILSYVSIATQKLGK